MNSPDEGFAPTTSASPKDEVAQVTVKKAWALPAATD